MSELPLATFTLATDIAFEDSCFVDVTDSEGAGGVRAGMVD